MVLHALDIVLDDPLIDAEQLEEIGQELMTPGDIAGERFTGGGQHESAIFLVVEQAVAIEALHHVGDARLGDLETGRDIDHAGVTLRVDQFEDALEVIFDRGGIADGVVILAGTMGGTSRRQSCVLGQTKNIFTLTDL